MGAKVTMGGSGTLFVGEDKSCRLELLDEDSVPVNMTGWGVTLVVKSTAGEPLISAAASITGSYNAVRATNTQRAVVTLTDTLLTIDGGTHRHSWKRTDDGSETILAYGPFVVETATQA